MPPLIVVLALLFPAAATGADLAITLDDLPSHGSLPPGITRLALADQIVEVLRRHGIRDAVGFVNGGQIADTPELGIILEHWIAAGYRLGNHTFGHVDLDRTGPDGFLADVERNEPVIARYGGTEADRAPLPLATERFLLGDSARGPHGPEPPSCDTPAPHGDVSGLNGGSGPER